MQITFNIHPAAVRRQHACKTQISMQNQIKALPVLSLSCEPLLAGKQRQRYVQSKGGFRGGRGLGGS